MKLSPAELVLIAELWRYMHVPKGRAALLLETTNARRMRKKAMRAQMRAAHHRKNDR